MGRALHALLYAQEFHEAKVEVKVYFDGQGTLWVKQPEDPSHMFNPLYKAVKATGVLAGVCESCADAFGVTEEVAASGIELFSDAGDGHFSNAKLIAGDYQIITL
ncbi:DsrE family protein [Paenibacillus sp. R14(2021)]|uniref:DsrE family protein n=1 Tax=Paenibacillus sp. R14(2021) TaxID=2859228 RepID=UPI001C611B5C|nr:DsrE family protein [Paenibacillus sp. R14(2021)]